MNVIALTGAVGVGKTEVGRTLAHNLPNWVLTRIDDHPDWSALVDRVNHLRTNAIIESVLIPPRYRAALRRHNSALVVITCDEAERLRRLEMRGEGRPIGHLPPQAVDIAFDNTPTPLDEGRVQDLLRTIGYNR